MFCPSSDIALHFKRAGRQFQVVNLGGPMLGWKAAPLAPGSQGNNENGTPICPQDHNGYCHNNGVGFCECTMGNQCWIWMLLGRPTLFPHMLTGWKAQANGPMPATTRIGPCGLWNEADCILLLIRRCLALEPCLSRRYRLIRS